MSALQNLYKMFQEDAWYPLRISLDQYGDLRFTQAKISMFGKGFKFQKGEAKFPTEFEVIEKEMNSEGYLILKGRLRDNDDHEFLLSLDADKKGADYAKCGHSKKGDWVVLEIRHSLSYGSKDSLLEGRVRVLKHPEVYSLLTNEDKEILKKGDIGEKAFIFMSHSPVPQ